MVILSFPHTMHMGNFTPLRKMLFKISSLNSLINGFYLQMIYSWQAAINLFLGVYRPMDHPTPLWELVTDHYLHNQPTSVLQSLSSTSYTGWWNQYKMKHLPLPYQLSKIFNILFNIMQCSFVFLRRSKPPPIFFCFIAVFIRVELIEPPSFDRM